VSGSGPTCGPLGANEGGRLDADPAGALDAGMLGQLDTGVLGQLVNRSAVPHLSEKNIPTPTAAI
jgi:hypothetical protein